MSLDHPSAAPPTDAALRALVTRCNRLVAAASPVSYAAPGEVPALPGGGAPREAELLADLAEVEGHLRSLAPMAASEDETDRLVLAHGVYRALAAHHPGDPTGAETVEQHLQAALLVLLRDPGAAFPALVDLLESAPSFLRAGRPAATRGAEFSSAAGHLAVAATKRLPLLLDVVAAAGRELAPVTLRLRVEAALGPLLMAGAEESGYLLREYLPAAGEAPAPPALGQARADPGRAGLRGSLSELEADAEAALADAVLAAGEPPAQIAGGPLASVVAVASAWDAAAALDPVPGLPAVTVMATPGWLEPLLPTLALVLPGPTDPSSPLLLVGRGPIPAGELEMAHRAEYLAWALGRVAPRLARVLLPVDDIATGWRAMVGRDLQVLVPAWPRELAWRAALALAAVSMLTRGTSVDAAAALVAAEAGLDIETARLQVQRVSRRPLAALAFPPAARAVRSALSRVTVAELLGAGPLSVAAIDRLAPA